MLGGVPVHEGLVWKYMEDANFVTEATKLASFIV